MEEKAMLEQSSILEKMAVSLMGLFWFTGILESKQTTGQDILGSLIFEFLTTLKQARSTVISLVMVAGRIL